MSIPLLCSLSRLAPTLTRGRTSKALGLCRSMAMGSPRSGSGIPHKVRTAIEPRQRNLYPVRLSTISQVNSTVRLLRLNLLPSSAGAETGAGQATVCVSSAVKYFPFVVPYVVVNEQKYYIAFFYATLSGALYVIMMTILLLLGLSWSLLLSYILDSLDGCMCLIRTSQIVYQV